MATQRRGGQACRRWEGLASERHRQQQHSQTRKLNMMPRAAQRDETLPDSQKHLNGV